MLRIVFIGMNNALAATHLETVAARHAVVGIIESVPPRPIPLRLLRPLRRSRLQRFARRRGIGYRRIGPRQRSELLRFLHDRRPQLVCIVSMPWLLPAEALAVPPLGTINLHPSLLPAYRGPEPLFWQVYDGVRKTGITVHLADEREDQGPIVAQRAFAMPPGIGYGDLVDLINEHGPPLLLEALDALAAGNATARPQPAASPTRRARRVSRREAVELINWRAWSPERVARVLRGAGPALDLPPVRWRDLGRRPRIGGVERLPTAGPPGSLRRDARGFYLAHPAGRIRVTYVWEPRAWLDGLVRRWTR